MDTRAFRRPGFKLSVRSGLVVVAVFALLMAVWTSYFDPVTRWKRAIHDDNESGRRWEAAIRGVNGQVPGVSSSMAVDELIGALRDPSFRVRETSAAVLGRAGIVADPAVPALIAALKDPNPNVRGRAVSSLGEIALAVPKRIPAVVPELLTMLKDRHQETRMMAAFTLAQLGEGEAALPILIEMVDQNSVTSRATGIWSIGKLGLKGRPAVPSLLKVANGCVSDPDPWMRLRAVEAAEVLISLGEAETSRRILLQTSKDPHPEVRKEADRALKDLNLKAEP